MPEEAWRQYGSVPGGKLFSADPTQVKLGAAGDVYVLGTVETGVDRSSMAVWKYDPNGVLAQGFPALYPDPASNTSGKFVGVAMAITPGFESIYVTGHGPGAGRAKDILTMRIDGGGSVLWAQPFDRFALDDVPADIAVNEGDAVYVAGTSGSPESSNDIVVIRYDESGTLLRKVAYDGPGKGDDTATKIFVQTCTGLGGGGPGGDYPFDRVYVGGTSFVGTYYPGDPSDHAYDYVVLCYEPDLQKENVVDPDEPEWLDLYHGGVAGGSDTLVDFVVHHDGGFGCEGFIYATGYSERLRPDGGKDNDYATLGMDRLTGARVWGGAAHRYNGFGDGHDYASGIFYAAHNGIGSIYVTGTSYGGLDAENEIATIAIAVSNATTRWRARFNRLDEFQNPLPGDDRGVAIGGVAHDVADGVYVTGRYYNGADVDFVTLRYSANPPNFEAVDLWSITHDSGVKDFPSGMAVFDPAFDHKHVYVVGMSPPPPPWSGATDTQQTLIKYVQRLP